MLAVVSSRLCISAQMTQLVHVRDAQPLLQPVRHGVRLLTQGRVEERLPLKVPRPCVNTRLLHVRHVAGQPVHVGVWMFGSYVPFLPREAHSLLQPVRHGVRLLTQGRVEERLPLKVPRPRVKINARLLYVRHVAGEPVHVGV